MEFEPFPYDRIVKDIFLHDRPSLTKRIIGDKRVRAIISTDLPKTIERRADLALLVDPGDLHHFEFQSTNFRKLPYRQGVTCFLLAERYPNRRIIQTVVYFGEAPLRMPPGIDVGAGQVRYQLVDIRQFDAADLAASGSPADLVLAVLARGGRAQLRPILERIYALSAPERDRALAQLALLSGLRRLTEPFKMEMEHMGLVAEFKKNHFMNALFGETLDKALDEERKRSERAVAEGLARGRELGLEQGREQGHEQGRELGLEQGLERGLVQGRAAGERMLLRIALEAKFGTVPRWALQQIEVARQSELERLMRKSVTASSVNELFGRKPASAKRAK
jgi:hypothetical protein